MMKLFTNLLEKLGNSQDNDDDLVALTAIYCMFLVFAMFLMVTMLAVT